MPPTTPLHAPLSMFRASELCAAAGKLASHGADSDAPALLLLIEQGWSPFIHSFANSRLGGYGEPYAFFSTKPSQSALFRIAMERFPVAASHFKFKSAVSSPEIDPWTRLGPDQKTFLLLEHGSELLGPPPLSRKSALAWIRALAASLCPQPDSSAQSLPEAEPFFGYFDSPHWASITKREPELARALAARLGVLATLGLRDGVPALASWRDLALGALDALPPSAHPVGELADDPLAAHALIALIESDRADLFAPLHKAFGLDPSEGEARMLASIVRGADSFTQCVAQAENHKLWPGPKPSALSFKKSLESSAPLQNQKLWPRPSDLPLFAFCSLYGAHSVWNFLAALHELPLGLSHLASQSFTLRSPKVLREQALRHGAKALGGAHAAESPGILAANFAREIQASELLLSRIGLDSDLATALDAREPSPRSDWTSNAPPQELHANPRERSRALKRVLSGRNARISFSVPFDWLGCVLAMGSATRFFSDKLEAGALSSSCRRLSLIERRFSDSDIAAIEQDEMRWALRDHCSSPASKAPRL